MKTILALGALLISVSAFANSGVLDGKSYCRTVVSDGSFGQPAGERQHCINFTNGVASDDANTFFGNPPEYSAYEVNGQKVIFADSEYNLSADGNTLTTVKGSTVEGTVLSLKK